MKVEPFCRWLNTLLTSPVDQYLAGCILCLVILDLNLETNVLDIGNFKVGSVKHFSLLSDAHFKIDKLLCAPLKLEFSFVIQPNHLSFG